MLWTALAFLHYRRVRRCHIHQNRPADARRGNRPSHADHAGRASRPSDHRTGAGRIELAELVGDESFRARVRDIAVAGSNQSSEGEQTFDPAPVQEHAGSALAAGIDPTSPEAGPILARRGVGRLNVAARAELADRIDTFSDRRVERYGRCSGSSNRAPAFPSMVPAFEWYSAALRSR